MKTPTQHRIPAGALRAAAAARSARAAAAALLLALAFLFAACSNPLAPAAADPPGPALVEVALNLRAEPGRIVLPGLPALSEIASYQLFGSRENGPQSLLGSWTSLAGASVSLKTGLWEFVLAAYDAEDQLLLEGRLWDREIGVGSSLQFELRGVEEGTGSVEVTLLWPEAGSLVYRVEASLDGAAPLSLAPQPVPPSGLAVSYSKAELPAGDYLLNFRFLDYGGATLATRSEWLLVRQGLKSAAEISLAAEDFDRRPAAPSGLSLVAGTLSLESLEVQLSWVDNSDNEEGFSLEYSLDSGLSWQSLARLPAGSTSYTAALPRGYVGVYGLRAYNAHGSSSSISDGIRSPAQLYFSTEDEEIETVQVNLWDPEGQAFRGGAEFRKAHGGWVGSIRPQVPGDLLVQAYGYDAAGNIRMVAETRAEVGSPSATIGLNSQPVRLMGGNVQRIGQSLAPGPSWLAKADTGLEVYDIRGATSDGLNLYIATSDGILRRVLSSSAMAYLAGHYRGIDEDHPGQTPSYAQVTALTTDGKQLYLLHALKEVSRIGFGGSAKRLFALGSDERLVETMSSDGSYLYLNNEMIHRVELASLERTTLDPADWSWKEPGVERYVMPGALTSDGQSLFFAAIYEGKLRSMPLGGGAPTELGPVGYGGGLATDGSRLYGLFRRSRTNMLFDYFSLDLATKARTELGSFGEAELEYLVGGVIATDGRRVFGFKK